MARNQRDFYYRQAQESGYRSRASYKLKQIQDKEYIIRRNDTVVDLGAAPGGWLQVARELSRGKIFGVDLQPIKPIQGVTTIVGDITSEETIEKVLEFAGDAGVDVVLCDAAPNLSGNWAVDHARGIDLNEAAFECAEKILKPGGNFVVKVFQGDMFKNFYDKVSKSFVYTKAFSPPASRSTSAEIYIICKNFIATSLRKGDVYDVLIESMGNSGDGIAYIDNFVVFVPGTDIGDEVSILLKDIKPKYAFGKVISKEEADIIRQKIENSEKKDAKKPVKYKIEPDEEFDEYDRAFE
ncbi:MAG: TRAM domain-containing protein [Methanosarcinaceae archaeon]|nr:TRAM domain-containing protein [Methanosarcinaceae archaeon]